MWECVLSTIGDHCGPESVPGEFVVGVGSKYMLFLSLRVSYVDFLLNVVRERGE